MQAIAHAISKLSSSHTKTLDVLAIERWHDPGRRTYQAMPQTGGGGLKRPREAMFRGAKIAQRRPGLPHFTIMSAGTNPCGDIELRGLPPVGVPNVEGVGILWDVLEYVRCSFTASTRV